MFRLAWAAAIALPLLAQQSQIQLTRVAAGLNHPTDIENAGDGSKRLFIAQQDGIIRVLQNGVLLPAPFLDISGRTVGDGESGLLGLAFPPDYQRKQYFYVNYTNLDGDTVIARYRATTADSDIADPESETILLTIAQPFTNHNGGLLRFGPDGYLYIAMGDGGGAEDTLGNAQNPASLLGKMLRIDVESDPGRLRIPPDNPFLANSSYRPEIWAVGLRNPWRFSFDRSTGDLWIADVGQDRAEEVNFQPAASRGGENYGWNPMEGLQCLHDGCTSDGFVLPVAEYEHTDGCAVIGGFVYRGKLFDDLRGIYFYADHCSGYMWGLRGESGPWVSRLLLQAGFSISAFGEDETGELFLAAHGNGEIYRITAASPESLANPPGSPRE